MRRGAWLGRLLLGFRPADPIQLRPLAIPHLVAVLSVLGLVADNPSTGIRLTNLAAPLFLSVVLAHAVWVLTRSFSPEANRRALLGMGLCGLFLFFGPARDLLVRAVGPLGGGGIAGTILIAGVALGVAFALVRKPKPNLEPVTYFLFVTLAIGFGWLGVRSAVVLSNPAGSMEEVHGEFAFGSSPDGGGSPEDPDVFIVILDGYASPEVLRRSYDLELTPFTDSLRALGFVVPERGRANYGQTYLSLASMLDWRYLHEEMLAEGSERRALQVAFSRLARNATTEFLVGRGYHFLYFRSSYPPLNHNPLAHEHVPGHLPTDLERIWFQSTALPAVINLICRGLECGGGLGFTPDAPEILRRRLEAIGEVPEGDQPLFVFAHILLPHEPFVFNEDCSSRPPLLPRSVPEHRDQEVRAAYRSQVECLNRMVLPLARRLAHERTRPAVVVFQSDHGYGRLGLGWGETIDQAGSERVTDRLSAFGAYYLPGGASLELDDDVTAVNAVRRVFAEAYDLDLPPLRDESFWASYAHPLAFERWDPPEGW